ncbi:uncharacterized protein [Palaemon carinicauda]|uniref:uncharacterized protein n=1 Tax=Palaemon carinicauda TaxID=392227 RepID=UPI0035B684BB
MFLQIFSLFLFWTSSPSSASTNEYDNYVDIDDLGPYANMVAATNAILPEIADVFDRVNRDARLDIDPFSPEGIRDAMLAFLPVSRSVLLAAAQVEGRRVTQDDLDRLTKIEHDLPLAFEQISSLNSLRSGIASNLEEDGARASSAPAAPYVAKVSGIAPNTKEDGVSSAPYSVKSFESTLPAAQYAAEVSGIAPNTKVDGVSSASYGLKAFQSTPETLRISQQAVPLLSTAPIPTESKPDAYKPIRRRIRVQSDSTDPLQRNQTPSSSPSRSRVRTTTENTKSPTSIENVFFGRSAIDLIQPLNARVLRGAIESLSSESKSPGSSTFIKLPHSQVVFIRHPLKKDVKS